MTDKYILDGHTPVPCPDVLVWGAWYEDSMRDTRRRVGYTILDDGDDPLRVSTAFLGLDHNFTRMFTGNHTPILFETMIFGTTDRDPSRLHEWQRRYADWDSAQKGHEYAVRLATRARRFWSRWPRRDSRQV